MRCSTSKVKGVCFKRYLHGRVLAARTDILLFFFLKSRRSFTRRKIHVRSLSTLPDTPPKKANRSSHSHGRDFNATLAYAQVTYTLRLRASDSRKTSRRKSCYRTGSLTRCEIVSNIGVARIFDWGEPKPQITCNDVIKNFKRGTFCGGKDIVEWKIRNRGVVWHLSRTLLKGEGIKPIIKKCKCLTWETC